MARILHDPGAKIVTIDDGGFVRSGYGCAAFLLCAPVIAILALSPSEERADAEAMALFLASIAGGGIGICLCAYALRPRIVIDFRRRMAIRRGWFLRKSWPLAAFERVYLTSELRDDPESEDYRAIAYQIFLSGTGAPLLIAEDGDKAAARSIAREIAKLCDFPFRDGLLARSMEEAPPLANPETPENRPWYDSAPR